MGELKATNITLQMADRLIKRPIRVLKDVPMKVGKHFIPIDFVVLDIAEDTDIFVILGRPFLCTDDAVIDLRKRNLTMAIGEETMTFHLPTALCNPMIEETIFSIYIVDETAMDLWTTSLAIDSFNTLIGLRSYAGKSTFFSTGSSCEIMKDVTDMNEERSRSYWDEEALPIGETLYQSVDDPTGGLVMVERAEIMNVSAYAAKMVKLELKLLPFHL
ncbi:hypothetical protein vseg_003406 [Gypsophila vaccaria]